MEGVRGMVGRGSDVAQLDVLLEEALRGRGQLTLVAGEPGIGKSWLAARLAARARDADATVVWAGCPAGTAPAFWPWRELLHGLGADARVNPALGRLLAPPGASAPATDDAEADRLELFGAVADALRAAAAPRPVVAVIDDLHWADPASLRLLVFIAPLLRGLPVLVLATARDEESQDQPALAEAMPHLLGHGRHLELGGLNEFEVEALAHDVAGRPLPDGVADVLHRHTGGNPLFVRELVRFLQQRDALDELSRASRSIGVPQSVRAVLSQRVARLPATTQSVLEVAAAVGEAFTLDVLQQVTGLAAPELLQQLEPALLARFVAPVSVGRYAFGHALIRAALEAAAGPAGRIRLHQDVGEALEALRARGARVNVDDLAYHWLVAAPAGHGDRAVRYAWQAAEQAEAMLAHEQAARLYEQALSVLDLDPAAGERGHLLLALAEALVAAGDLPRSRAVFEEAAEVARSTDQAPLLARAALGLGAGAGGFEIPLLDQGQVDLLEEALAALSEEPSALRALVLARLSVALAYSATIEWRLALAEDAVAMARLCGDRPALAHALAAHCDAISGPADTERRLAEAGEVVDLAAALGDRRLELLGGRLRLVALLELGDTAGADTEIDAFERVAASLRQPLYSWYVPLWRGMRAAAQGRMTEAVERCDEAARVGGLAQSSNAEILTCVLAWTAYTEQGRPLEAAAAVGRLLDLMPELLGPGRWLNTALVHVATGDIGEACRSARQALPGLSQIPVDAEWLAGMVSAVDILRATGMDLMAAELYAWLLPFRHRHTVDGIGAADYGSLERHLGVLAALLGREADAREHLDLAVTANTRCGHRLGVARSLADIGGVLADDELLRQAAAAYGELGLTMPMRDSHRKPGPGSHEPTAPREVDPVPCAFRRDGALWSVTFAGRTAHLADRKGLHDICRLLASPGSELHVLDLAGAPAAARPVGASLFDADSDLHPQGDLGPVVDELAREAYRARLADLEDELAEAEAHRDAGRAARAQAERDALIEQLSSAVGLGGRPRRAGDPTERARSTVTRRIRDAIDHVERVHSQLGRHLRKSLRTGIYCAYDPERPVTWQL